MSSHAVDPSCLCEIFVKSSSCLLQLLVSLSVLPLHPSLVPSFFLSFFLSFFFFNCHFFFWFLLVDLLAVWKWEEREMLCRWVETWCSVVPVERVLSTGLSSTLIDLLLICCSNTAHCKLFVFSEFSYRATSHRLEFHFAVFRRKRISARENRKIVTLKYQ